MFPSTALLSAVLLAISLSASASPLPDAGISAATIPFLTKFAQKTGGGFDIVGADGARIRAMLARGRQQSQGKAGRLDAALPPTQSPDAGVPNDTEIAPNSGTASAPSSFGVTNAAVVYTASVGIGMPATQYTLLIDTGSSNTWVGSGKRYAATSTSKDTGRAVSVSYGSGSFTGREYLDRVTLSPNLVINQQSIGIASSSSGFESMDGVLGLGPTTMTAGTLDDGNNDDTVPTVTDSLFSQHTISTAVLAISFQPTSSSSPTGELTFGGTDPSKYTGQITYTPLTKSSPASCYWGIEQSVNYDGRPLLPATPGIVDTGTTLLYLASDAYAKYAKLTGATHDQQTGFLRITPAQYSALKNLNFVVSGRTFAFTPNAQIWPRAMNDYIGGSKDYVYLIVNDLGTPSGSGLDFISGFGFLTRFYSVFDTSNKRVGLATTQYTNANTN